MRTLPPLLALLLLAGASAAGAGAAAAAEAKPQASGRFASSNTSFEALGAYAFPAEVGFDPAPGYRVAVSNAGFVAAVLDRYWDRENAIDSFFVDPETVVVYFHFGKDGKYLGL
jgi:hypothetical protein